MRAAAPEKPMTIGAPTALIDELPPGQRGPKIRPCGVRKVYQAAPEKCAKGHYRWRMEWARAGPRKSA
jgi:hypothetical protein